MFYDSVCLNGPHKLLIPSLRMRQHWRLWRHEYDVI